MLGGSPSSLPQSTVGREEERAALGVQLEAMLVDGFQFLQHDLAPKEVESLQQVVGSEQ